MFNEDAQKLVSKLYYPGCLCLDRKYQSSKKIMSWVRPPDMVKVTWQKKKWTPEEDYIVINFSAKEASKKLNRTLQSINMRAWRLRAVSIPL
jgi:hypothetical protein